MASAGELPDDDALSPDIATPNWQIVAHDETLATTGQGATDPAAAIEDWTVTSSTVLTVPSAAQLRIHFADWSLPGDEGIDGAMLRLTSLADGASQDLGPAQMAAWSGAPAYFNGDAVRVELLVRGSPSLTRSAFAHIAYAEALSVSYAARAICDTVDDRVLDADPIVARIWPVGCTSTIIQDANGGFLTAGHCGPASGSVVQFNVPLSSSTGAATSPPPADQFPVDFASVQRVSLGVGNDWSYFGALTNSTTLTASQRQGPGATLLPAAPVAVGAPLRIAGFGVVSSPVSLTWNSVLKTHDGPLVSVTGNQVKHRVDTTGGNSGSAIMLDSGPNGASRAIIGIHTHAGCGTTATSANNGTAIEHPDLQAALANPLGICASGDASINRTSGVMWIGPDAANNIGAIEIDSAAGAPAGTFDARTKIPGTVQAMAFDPVSARVIAITSTLAVYAVSPSDASIQLLGTLTTTNGVTPSTITGLAITGDGQWYAVAQASSVLYRVTPATLRAQSLGVLGSVGALRIGALEADTDPRYLLALEDNVTLGTRLLEIDLAPQVPTWRIIGALGAGATDCNALGRSADGQWIAVDAPTGRMLQVDRQSGAATLRAQMQGSFLSSMGMTWVPADRCLADFDVSGGVDSYDVAAFFAVYESGDPLADLDLSGGVEPADIAVFFAAYESGC